MASDLTPATRAENIYQASLNLSGPGGTQLNFGHIYFRTTDNQTEFLAVIFPFGNWPVELNPTLTTPDASFDFTLGAATRTWLHGARTVADRNPFLPAEPWLPHSYDEQGNPLYLDTTNIRLADIYTGQFTLPAGFSEALAAGWGRIDFNSTLGGAIRNVTVPEPTTAALLLLASLSHQLWRQRPRRMST